MITMTTTMDDCDNENDEDEAVAPCHRPIPTMLWMEIPASFTTTAIQTNSNQYNNTLHSISIFSRQNDVNFFAAVL